MPFHAPLAPLWERAGVRGNIVNELLNTYRNDRNAGCHPCAREDPGLFLHRLRKKQRHWIPDEQCREL